ncbi:MAG: hypothetical protein JST82_14835 [Bacteroidetes bacterium]|nr:hypothetical protein [Bacteroidota bacterium]
MKKVVKAILITLSVLTGLVFIFSSYTKIDTVESFEAFQYATVEYLHLPWIVAAIACRVLIGFEAALGVLLCLQFYGRGKWVLKSALYLLIAFSIYLIYLWIKIGNNINCGCFGNTIWMSPSQSLIKNIILVIPILILIRYYDGFRITLAKFVVPIALIVSVATPFVNYQIPDTKPQWLNKGRFQINLSALYAPGKQDAPKVDLYKGKHIIAFFSLGCPHCRMAAKKMRIMKERNPNLPFYMVLAGTHDWKEFWEDTKVYNIPYTRLDSKPFLDLTGGTFPRILYLKDGWAEAENDYISLDQQSIEEWLSKP